MEKGNKEKESLGGYKKVFEGFKLHRGHTLWAVNLSTFEIKEAEFSVIDEKSKRRQVIKDPELFYIGSLNKKSAINKLIRSGIIRKNIKA